MTAKLDSEMTRVPPGQRVTERLPVLHYGGVPEFDKDTWELHIWGLVKAERVLTYDEVVGMPTSRIVADIHCVTGWSKLDSVWEGVLFRHLVEQVEPLPDARFVMIHAEHGYTANLPLDVLLEKDVLLAWKYNEALLAPQHGFPLRLVVPSRYFWKSVKWVRGIEFMAHDRLGFWEQYGYHNNADPWKEERYAR